MMPIIPLVLLALLVFYFPVAMISALVVLLIMVLLVMSGDCLRRVSLWAENKFMREREDNPNRLNVIENWCILMCVFLVFVIAQLLVVS